MGGGTYSNDSSQIRDVGRRVLPDLADEIWEVYKTFDRTTENEGAFDTSRTVSLLGMMAVTIDRNPLGFDRTARLWEAARDRFGAILRESSKRLHRVGDGLVECAKDYKASVTAQVALGERVFAEVDALDFDPARQPSTPGTKGGGSNPENTGPDWIDEVLSDK